MFEKLQGMVGLVAAESLSGIHDTAARGWLLALRKGAF